MDSVLKITTLGVLSSYMRRYHMVKEQEYGSSNFSFSCKTTSLVMGIPPSWHYPILITAQRFYLRILSKYICSILIVPQVLVPALLQKSSLIKYDWIKYDSKAVFLSEGDPVKLTSYMLPKYSDGTDIPIPNFAA